MVLWQVLMNVFAHFSGGLFLFFKRSLYLKENSALTIVHVVHSSYVTLITSVVFTLSYYYRRSFLKPLPTPTSRTWMKKSLMMTTFTTRYDFYTLLLQIWFWHFKTAYRILWPKGSLLWKDRVRQEVKTPLFRTDLLCNSRSVAFLLSYIFPFEMQTATAALLLHSVNYL